MGRLENRGFRPFVQFSSTKLSTASVDKIAVDLQAAPALSSQGRQGLRHAVDTVILRGLFSRHFPHCEPDMKPELHPNYVETKVTCSCGNEFSTRSTLGDTLTIEVCSSCHPFYTGKQKIMDSGGRVDKFRKKYGMGA